MRWVLTIILCLFLCYETLAENRRIKKVPINGDQIVTIHTAIGIATIIQVPDRPSSVVVGDQESFRVEYLDQAITIKPIRHGAKSNLYVYTDWKRYNVQLVTGSEEIADYVVYLENPKTPPQDKSIIWTPFRNILKSGELHFEITRLGHTKSGVLLVEFKVSASNPTDFKPEWIWITQDRETKPIHSLFLSSLKVAIDRPLTGVLQILKNDLDITQPIHVELRRKKISFMTIPKVDLWK